MADSTDSAPSPRTRRFLIVLACICALGALLRLFVCMQLCAEPFVAQPAVVTDMATYKQLALEIRHGQWPSHFYYQPFYYAVFLPLIYLIAGSGAWGPAVVQLLLGTATIWLTGLATANLFGRKAGLAAAVLIALARYPIFYTPFLLIATLQSFWMALLIYLALRYWRHPSRSRLVALGLVTAGAVLTRGNVLLLVPGILALIFWRHRSQRRHATFRALAYVLLVAAPQLPFSLRNLMHYGRWTGPSSAQDAVLALGNTPEAPAGGLEYPISYHDWMDRANQNADTRVPVSRQMLRWALDHPLQFAELKGRMLLLFWHRMEIPNNIAMEHEGQHSSLLRLPQPFLLDFSVIGILSLTGMMLQFHRKSPPRLLACGIVVIYCLGIVLFYILARFRLPLVPILCLFGGAAIRHLIHTMQKGHTPEKRRRRMLAATLALVASTAIVLDGYTWYQRILAPTVARIVRPHGTVVDTHRRLLIYDRGPFSLGGLVLAPVPDEGMTVSKRFVIPDTTPNTPRVRLRIPVSIQPNSRFDVRAAVADQVYTAADMSVEEGDVCQRLIFEIPPPAAGDPFDITLTLIPEKGQIAVALDTTRWYGRSDYRRGQQQLPLEAEAAFELEWLKDEPGES